MDTRLIIFDIDGTLVDRDTQMVLPGVWHFFSLIPRARNTRVAFATNQGGPACRDAGWGSHYPSLADVVARYTRIVNDLLGDDSSLYMSLVYQTPDGRLIRPKGLLKNDPRLNPEWRKPKPGMLLQAMADAGVRPEDTLMIGDSPSDQQAAAAAGCAFQWAQKFFGRG